MNQRKAYDTRVIVARLVEKARPIILEYYTPDSCIASTRIALDVLRHFGIETYALSVKAMLFNRIYRDHYEAIGRAPSDQEAEAWFAAGAHSIGLGYGGDGRADRWPGHLVAIAARSYLVDLSLDQAARPQKDMEVTGHATPVTEAFLRGRGVLGIEAHDGTLITYQAVVGDKSYQASPNWTTPESACIQRIIQEMVEERLVV